MNQDGATQRQIGLFGATSVGVGAIVGGGILALAGVAFSATGPSAILAFALNGAIALLTALSFAEMSAAFPQSGGTYTFAKKVLSVEAAFAVGWVVWFASIVAAVLYALGFGYFACETAAAVWRAATGAAPDWMTRRPLVTGLALIALCVYTASLVMRGGSGGQWVNVGKVVVFAILIAAGLAAVSRASVSDLRASTTPFFSAGAMGLVQAMGFTFIALQGFDLIAAVAGEIRKPAQTIPRAMLLSLGIALVIYLPLLFVIATVGVPPGDSVTAASRRDPETIVAIAARQYLGQFGYWLVLVAAILSMLSALQANLFAASRVALAMAGDRTLPNFLSAISRRGTPVTAIVVTSLIVMAIVVVLPDVAAAGAAASLIFLVTFALAHWISILFRRRSRRRTTFRTPLFPLVPLVGMLACIALALFQGFAVPAAGIVSACWLTVGGVLFVALFARRARIVDASAEALDPEVARLRGRNPLVLVPLANPAHAASMVAVADALAAREVGRVLLLSVVKAEPGWQPDHDARPLDVVQSVLREALAASLRKGMSPEALTTVAAEPLREIIRVARIHRCESMLLGLSDLSEDATRLPLGDLISGVDCDVTVLRAPSGWNLTDVKRVLVAIGGRGGHDALRARLLGSLNRHTKRHVTFLRVVPANTPEREIGRVRRELARFSRDETGGSCDAVVVASDAAARTIVEQAVPCDLIILGVQRVNRRQKAFGDFTLAVARETDCPIIMISRRG